MLKLIWFSDCRSTSRPSDYRCICIRLNSVGRVATDINIVKLSVTRLEKALQSCSGNVENDLSTVLGFLYDLHPNIFKDLKRPQNKTINFHVLLIVYCDRCNCDETHYCIATKIRHGQTLPWVRTSAWPMPSSNPCMYIPT